MALQKKISGAANISEIAGRWRFSLAEGGAHQYRLAQLDDYSGLPRRALPQTPPVELRLRARASQPALPGTWGFGLWNDPFGLSLGFGGTSRRLPTLPNAAWYFFASPENFLSLRNAQPGNGQLIGTYRSPSIPSLLLAPSLIGVPLALVRPISRWLRRLAARIIRHELVTASYDAPQWHDYALRWQQSGVEFSVDDKLIHRTSIAPKGRLGLVVWLDNQYAAWRPDGGLAYGTLPTPANCWVEIANLQITRP